jgi:hypothetical protein
MGAMYLSLALAVTAIPFTLGTEWLNAKRVAKDKKCEVQVDAWIYRHSHNLCTYETSRDCTSAGIVLSSDCHIQSLACVE